MTVEVYDSEPFEMMEKVAALTMKGKSELAIARELKIPRIEVINHQKTWRKLLSNDKYAQDAAKDMLNQMVSHYDILIKELYELYEDLKGMNLSHQVAAQINATIKNIADFDKTRVDLMQKAGMLEGSEMGDLVAEMERKQEILIDILRNDLCDDCQKVVKRRLSEVTNKVEVIRVHPDD